MDCFSKGSIEKCGQFTLGCEGRLLIDQRLEKFGFHLSWEENEAISSWGADDWEIVDSKFDRVLIDLVMAFNF